MGSESVKSHHQSNSKQISSTSTSHPFQSQKSRAWLSRHHWLISLKREIQYFFKQIWNLPQIWGWILDTLRDNQSYRHSRFNPVNWWFAQRRFGFTGTCHFLLLGGVFTRKFHREREFMWRSLPWDVAEEIVPDIPTYVQYIYPWSLVAVLALRFFLWKRGSILLLRVMLFLDVVIAWNDLEEGSAHQPFSQVCKCSQHPSSYFCWPFPFSFSSPSSCLWRMMKCRPGKLRLMQ